MLQLKVEAEQKFFGILIKHITQKAVHFLAIAVRANIHVIAADYAIHSLGAISAEDFCILPHFWNNGTMAV